MKLKETSGKCLSLEKTQEYNLTIKWNQDIPCSWHLRSECSFLSEHRSEFNELETVFIHLVGFRRRAAPVTRRQFPHGAHRMDYLHFEDDSRGWWFDMDMVIIYIYSVNWVIGFIVFCFLCYFFFPF